MLESLHFENVGPAPKLGIELAPRLNFLAGDNGLDKTFVLDVAWWALTRTWARNLVMPHRPPASPQITYQYGTKSGGPYSYRSTFQRDSEQWSGKQGRPPIPGMVIYAQVDGGFSVWDPARNYWKKDSPERPRSYRFEAREVWEGNTLCEGLIRDWASWQRESGNSFHQLARVLRALSPSPEERLEPGELQKISLDDPRRHPTLKMPYGQDVPLIHASAGMRRIVALAYLLVWTWQEHLEASKLQGKDPAREIILLIDEIEAHLHPQWQRRIVPALLEVMEALTGSHQVPIQLITATHSPLVLAATGPVFDHAQDALFLLEAGGGVVNLERQPWNKQRDLTGWLDSKTFDLSRVHSLHTEEAIAVADA